MDSSAPLWHGRFDGDGADALRALNDSLAFDRRMFREDIAGSRAHATMLAAAGLLTDAERDAICAALDTVEAEMAEGRFVAAPGDEDIHTAVERRVTEITPAGAKLHTGRSRNDQVAADVRLWTRGALDEVAAAVLGLQRTLLRCAEQAGEALLPGYTHLQQAQPVLLAHHLLAHGWALARDVQRLDRGAQARADVSPLGAGALAGSSLPLDPQHTAAELGFGAVFDNSLDAVSDRDFVLDALYALAALGVHLSRLGEELVLWSSAEFGFVELDDAYATGSSMMPQKKNPDVAELARAKAGRLIGHLTGMLATLKGLPLAYAKDLQEDKEPLFDAFDTVRLTLAALDGLVATARFDTDRMAVAASSPYAAATDLAERLVVAGMPFRQAHATVGELVRRSLAGEGALAELVAADERFGPEAAALLEPGASAARRNTPGAGGPEAVARQIEQLPRAARRGCRWPARTALRQKGDATLLQASSQIGLGVSGGTADAKRLSRDFYARGVLEVAPELLNKVLIAPDGRAGRIVEVEAYGGDGDPGSHASRGQTKRNATMFGPPGRLYVYFTYGMHWCSNVVVESDGTAGAVLLRALTPLAGLDAMFEARGPVARRERDLCSGPAKLTQALGIDGALDAADLVDADRGVTVADDGTAPPTDPATSGRIGLRNGAELPWRFYVPGVRDVSRL